MADESQGDVFDYVMSDTFVSETRPRPYRLGFRTRPSYGKPSIKELLALPDREFHRAIRNDCRLPYAQSPLQGELAELRQHLHHLELQVRTLTHGTRAKAAPGSHIERRGLDVDTRS